MENQKQVAYLDVNTLKRKETIDQLTKLNIMLMQDQENNKEALNNLREFAGHLVSEVISGHKLEINSITKNENKDTDQKTINFQQKVKEKEETEKKNQSVSKDTIEVKKNVQNVHSDSTSIGPKEQTEENTTSQENSKPVQKESSNEIKNDRPEDMEDTDKIMKEIIKPYIKLKKITTARDVESNKRKEWNNLISEKCPADHKFANPDAFGKKKSKHITELIDAVIKEVKQELINSVSEEEEIAKLANEAKEVNTSSETDSKETITTEKQEEVEKKDEKTIEIQEEQESQENTSEESEKKEDQKETKENADNIELKKFDRQGLIDAFLEAKSNEDNIKSIILTMAKKVKEGDLDESETRSEVYNALRKARNADSSGTIKEKFESNQSVRNYVDGTFDEECKKAV